MGFVEHLKFYYDIVCLVFGEVHLRNKKEFDFGSIIFLRMGPLHKFLELTIKYFDPKVLSERLNRF